MKNKLINLTLFLGMIFFIISTFVFWFNNPELTQMQVLNKLG